MQHFGEGIYRIENFFSRHKELKDLILNQIDSLDSELVILQQEQTQFEIEIQKYKDSLIVYDHKIDSINLNIENIRNYYGKKINNIRNSSPTELYNFLTDRYK